MIISNLIIFFKI